MKEGREKERERFSRYLNFQKEGAVFVVEVQGRENNDAFI